MRVIKNVDDCSQDEINDVLACQDVVIVLSAEEVKPLLSALSAYVSVFEGIEDDTFKIMTLLSQLREVL